MRKPVEDVVELSGALLGTRLPRCTRPRRLARTVMGTWRAVVPRRCARASRRDDCSALACVEAFADSAAVRGYVTAIVDERDIHASCFSYEDSDKVRQIREHPHVNVAVVNEGKAEWTSIAGSAEIVHDRAKAEQLWAKPLEAWFPDGLETPGLTLIKVNGETAEYWDGPSSAIARLVGLGVAMAKKDPDAFPGENRTVEL